MLFTKSNTATRLFNAAPDMSALVNDEMLKDSAFHPNLGGVTKGGMANHYPMTIMSLQGLGASDEDIRNFRSTWPRYRSRISDDLRLIDKGVITQENWPDYLGQANMLADFQRVFFEGLNATDDQNAYLLTVLERLQYALPMGLFHPLIRLSFAMMHGDKGLIADALAYWAIRYEDLYKRMLPPRTNLTTLSASAAENWALLRAAKPQVSVWGGSLSVCERLCSEPVLHDIAVAENFFITEENLELKIQEIGDRAISLYLYEPALTTLHGVTAYQALADITQQMLDSGNGARPVLAELWQRYWVWLTGLYLEKGFPETLPTVATDAQAYVDAFDWEDIAKGIASVPEVHAIKMVFSCKWLYENIDANPLYKAAAINVLAEHTRVESVALG
ncbi:hypothetical protein A1OS_15740 [Enterovibrio norvegicus]|uniref:questin oxidase family protein n=1 Tax=Enterovibrio norvegicus TaxID=188144 RepID=UPI0002F392A1|nr:questin oxidase family protein [Enterovibrio norvegicus]OEE64721.1 hypothetical protein A1OS_15740 [Enterovibrio norvegicus]PMH60712.1 hypothetical protein BCU62_21440 [Enterovibrio norvegicus]